MGVSQTRSPHTGALVVDGQHIAGPDLADLLRMKRVGFRTKTSAETLRARDISEHGRQFRANTRRPGLPAGPPPCTGIRSRSTWTAAARAAIVARLSIHASVVHLGRPDTLGGPRIRHPNEASWADGAQFRSLVCTGSSASISAQPSGSRLALTAGFEPWQAHLPAGWLVVQFSGTLRRMSQPLTADDLLPLIAKLSSAERRKLFRLIQKVGSDVEAYRAVPPAQDEFSSDEDTLAWDGGGWEDVR